MPTPAALTTTLRLPGEDGHETVTVTTPAGRGAQNKHTKAVQTALDLPTVSSPGRAVKIGPGPRLATKPSSKRSAGAGWQRWTESDGTVRYGVVSDTHPSVLDLVCPPVRPEVVRARFRVVIPADGGEPFAIATAPGHPWMRDRDTEMIPALLQDCLPGLLIRSTELAA
ncbi:hypothetical protein [Streptomyces sp. NRRL WC-3742]|uniref:hypothetical protein n=1 Tax=Streptomyces sp. NRRL WC-3742 TaxID=1463934 RepID=UPI0004C49009|nr:hypothetical protein [Streptomyces sp. NRRL WC-3742]